MRHAACPSHAHQPDEVPVQSLHELTARAVTAADIWAHVPWGPRVNDSHYTSNDCTGNWCAPATSSARARRPFSVTCAAAASSDAFFIFIFKKQNFKNICRIGKFSKMGVCRPSSWRQDLNVKKLHLGHGAQGALNSELVKSI